MVKRKTISKKLPTLRCFFFLFQFPSAVLGYGRTLRTPSRTPGPVTHPPVVLPLVSVPLDPVGVSTIIVTGGK